MFSGTVMFDNVFETKENKIQTWIKLNHNINTSEISGVSFFAEKKGIFKHEYNMLSSHTKRSSVLWLHNKSHL